MELKTKNGKLESAVELLTDQNNDLSETLGQLLERVNALEKQPHSPVRKRYKTVTAAVEVHNRFDALEEEDCMEIGKEPD